MSNLPTSTPFPPDLDVEVIVRVVRPRRDKLAGEVIREIAAQTLVSLDKGTAPTLGLVMTGLQSCVCNGLQICLDNIHLESILEKD